MNVLITSEAAFSCWPVAKHLGREGHRIWVLDDLNAGDLASLHKEPRAK